MFNLHRVIISDRTLKVFRRRSVTVTGSKEFHRSRFTFSFELIVQLLRHGLNVWHWLTPLALWLSRPSSNAEPVGSTKI